VDTRRSRPASPPPTIASCAEGYVFSAAYQGAGHHDAVTFSWEMRPAGGGPVAARGFHFFVLGDDGRIRSDYQFTEPVSPA
jgi:hypothetical protein